MNTMEPERPASRPDFETCWNAILNRDEHVLSRYCLPGLKIGWHCRDDCFDVDRYIRACSAFPRQWTGRLEHLLLHGDEAFALARVAPPDRSASFHVAFLCRFSGNRIARLDEYWANERNAFPRQDALQSASL